LGLIVNEALTNALKYAFPDGREGTIRVALHRLGEGTYTYVLSVADDGIGLPAGMDPKRRRSLGMTLIEGFSRQLGGELTFTSPPGVRLCLVFADLALARHVEEPTATQATSV
jgi:two-component sensor histidine kinase